MIVLAFLSVSSKTIQKLGETWKKFKRPASMTENFMAEDAEYMIITHGMNSGTVKSAVSKMRQAGEKVGLLRLRTIRPFPADEVKAVNAKHIAVIEYSPLSPLLREVSSLSSVPCSSYVSAEGRLQEKDVFDVVKRLKAGKEEKAWL